MDFIPQAQLPYGMAEQLIRLKSQSGDAWAALAQNLGQSIAGGIRQRAQREQGSLTPEQLDAIRSYTTQPSGRQIPGQNGDPGITIGQSANQPLDKSMFPRGIPQPGMQLIEQANKNREQEALAKMTTDRIMGAQGLKNDAASNKLNIPVTDAARTLFQKAGLPLAEDAKTIRHEDYDAALKKVLGQDKGAAAKSSVGLRDEQYWRKAWVNAGKDMDLNSSSSRTPLGVAVRNNMSGGRAMKLLEGNRDTPFTPQDQSLITTDIAAIMKGASPDEELLRQQQYPSLYKSGVELLQKITGKPQELNNPEVKKHLAEVVRGIVDVDNKVIQDHVDSMESKHQDVREKRPKDWEVMKAKALKNVVAESKSAKGGDSLDALIDKHLGQ